MTLLVEDRALLDAFRRGDREALARVFTHYAEELARLLAGGFAFVVDGKTCRFQGYRSRFDLEDKLHEVFAKAFAEKARLGYDGLGSFRNYLFGIARHAVIDDFRSKQRAMLRFSIDDENLPEPVAEPHEESVEVLEGLVSNTGDPVRDVEHAELAGLLGRLRAELSAEEEEVFRLRFVEGRSLAEVEAQTGRSPSKVKTTEQRLRRRLVDTIWSSGYLDDLRGRAGGWFERLVAERKAGGKS